MRRLAAFVSYAVIVTIAVFWVLSVEVIVEMPEVEEPGPLVVWRPYHGYQTVRLHRYELQEGDYVHTGDGHYRRVDLWLVENPE